jgi:hypothetical protein
VARKLAPSIDPVVLKAQQDPHLPCIIKIKHKKSKTFLKKIENTI